jgi:hypothetical protein
MIGLAEVISAGMDNDGSLEMFLERRLVSG